MFFRLLLLLTLFTGLAAGPVRIFASCPAEPVEMKCGDCCGERASGCCSQSGAPAEQVPPSSLMVVDLKQALVPVRVFLGLQPEKALPPFSMLRYISARQPVQPRLDVTCIRLI